MVFVQRNRNREDDPALSAYFIRLSPVSVSTRYPTPA